jgi:hypothetical protein
VTGSESEEVRKRFWEVNMMGGGIGVVIVGVNFIGLTVDSVCVPGENEGKIKNARFGSLFGGLGVSLELNVIPAAHARFRSVSRLRQSVFEGWAVYYSGPAVSVYWGYSLGGGRFRSGEAVTETLPFSFFEGVFGATLVDFQGGYTWSFDNSKTFHYRGCG